MPPQGIKLTPKHYAYLKISEGCNHRCTFCIIPSMRGDLVSRPIDEVLVEAEKLVKGGVKELLVVSQDTSAYGVDLKYAEREWRGKAYATRMKDLCEGLGELGVWSRLHYVYPYPHVDDIRWVQDEPSNQGPWEFLELHFVPAMSEELGRTFAMRPFARPMAAAASTGSSAVHKSEEEKLLSAALGDD